MPRDFDEEENESSVNPLKDLLARYLPYWPLFVVLIACMLGIGVAYLKIAPKIYETSARILVKDEDKGLDEASILESLDLFGSKKIVDNEIEVVKSIDLLSQVVKDLQLYAPVYKDRLFKDVSAYTASPVTVEFLHPDSIPTLDDPDKVRFDFDSAKQLVRIDSLSYPVNRWLNTPYGKLRFNANPYYNPPDEKEPLYFEVTSVYAQANDLLERLQVESVSKLATIINITIKDAMRPRAENILNDLIKVYNREAVLDKNSLAANTLDFVQKRLDQASADLNVVEDKINAYRKAHHVFDISEQGKAFLTSSEKSNDQIVQNEVQKSVLDQIDAHLTGNGSNISTLGTLDPNLAALVTQLSDLETRYEGAKKTTGENNPLLVDLASRIALLKKSLKNNVENQRRNLAQGNKTVVNTQQKYAGLLSNIPQQERDLLQISREQTIKSNIYTFLLQKKEETELSLASTVPDSRTVERAHSTIKHVSPKAIIVLGIAIFLGLIIGMTFVSIKEVFNKNVMFRSEIEAMTKAPIVGEINHEHSKNPIVVGEGKRDYIAEQFRQLRTSLSYLGLGKDKNKILITSTVSGDGKSFVTANLGISLALVDKRVVLIELDLRKPRLADIFRINRANGLTNFIIGKASMDKIIKPIKDFPGLFIIPSGPIPPNPSELMLNPKLNELIAFLEESFDYIIIDTAPVSPVTDAYILSPLCDATLYVVRHKVTPKSALKTLDSSMKIHPLKNLAIVFNGVESRGFGNEYGYGYGNGSANGYGYTEEKGGKKKATRSLLS